ncbi:hypothetical protein GCM10011380_01010 [Sphingomonas metalli]|uniref:Ice-binding protein C-terminal domain-containing protein n=1 Tax=Sphingomonas metalli TaxID=1779358 RepID=A0A916ST38_9SPHN|nr:PEPxxWA-CTERM sorting domain-containing protein [Sphingomonas metalli]GGB15365.1 hypothetical protein GCM10011380_01010 [Sphingomonas metalli]
MRSLKLVLLATSMAFAPSVADAALTIGMGGNTTALLTLSSAGLNGGSVATLSGGTIYNSDQPFADIPKGGIFGNAFLAAGPLAGQPATLTFTNPVTYLSFLWGSPDTYNRVTLVTNQGTYNYSASSFAFRSTTGDQSYSDYVNFATSAGETIRSISFTNNPAIDAFETANFSVTAVPEPGTWAMMMLGFAMVGAAARYRRRSVRAAIA